MAVVIFFNRFRPVGVNAHLINHSNLAVTLKMSIQVLFLLKLTLADGNFIFTITKIFL